MKIEDITSLWDKDSKIDETELGSESTKIPQIHNKYLKIFMGERVQLIRLKASQKRTKKLLTEYYLGELDREELESLGRDQFYKKVLKQEIDTYIESDDMMIEAILKTSLQQEKVDYLEAILRQINNRGFQIKNAIDWNKFISG